MFLCRKTHFAPNTQLVKANDSQYGDGRHWERDYRLREGARLLEIMIAYDVLRVFLAGQRKAK